jgi:hypothetical protein
MLSKNTLAKDYQKALEIDPNFKNARDNLNNALKKVKKL